MITSLYNLIQENLLYANMQQFGLVFAAQNMPRMPKPYIVMNVLNIDIPDHLIYSPEINAQGFRDVSGWRKAVVELQFYNGMDSLSAASHLALILQTEPSLQSQDKLNCAIGARLFMAYVPEIINLSQFEGRAIYHFEYFYTETVPDNVGLIETVILDGTYTGGATESIVCHEEISYKVPYDSTDWDTETTWDNDSTVWDEVILEGSSGVTPAEPETSHGVVFVDSVTAAGPGAN